MSEEKENMEFVSSDDSPEKFPYGNFPVMPMKSNSSTSTDSMQDTPGSPKPRSRRLQQNQMNNFQDSEDSDVDMETDNFVGNNYPCNQDEEKSELSPDFKFKEHSLPQINIYEDFKDAARRRKFYHSEIQFSGREPSASASNSSQSFLKSCVYLILLCIICFGVASLYWSQYPDTPSSNGRLTASTLVKNLKMKFKNQPHLTFRIIFSALKNVLEVEPEAPAIILLLATNGSETLCSELAHSLVDSLNVPDYTVKIPGTHYKQANAKHAKMNIDKTISDKLKNDQLGSILIEDLDQIPGQAAIILHKYSDHENARFKKAVFVMTVNYNKAISNYSDTKMWDKAANDHLLSVWTDVGVDQATPLLARLTVSVGVINI
ncbi:unnamed protein product [Larinioides sclopetarius]